jgi:hypothetical protein
MAAQQNLHDQVAAGHTRLAVEAITIYPSKIIAGTGKFSSLVAFQSLLDTDSLAGSNHAHQEVEGLWFFQPDVIPALVPSSSPPERDMTVP